MTTILRVHKVAVHGQARARAATIENGIEVKSWTEGTSNAKARVGRNIYAPMIIDNVCGVYEEIIVRNSQGNPDGIEHRLRWLEGDHTL